MGKIGKATTTKFESLKRELCSTLEHTPKRNGYIFPCKIQKFKLDGTLDSKPVSSRVASVDEIMETYWAKTIVTVNGLPSKPFTCERCNLNGRYVQIKKPRFCQDCNELEKRDKRATERLKAYNESPPRYCDVCNKRMPIEAQKGQLRCSKDCMTAARMKRNADRYYREKKPKGEGYQRLRDAAMRARAEKRKERGIVCRECGGEIPPERHLAELRCSAECDEAQLKRGKYTNGPKTKAAAKKAEKEASEKS